MRGISKKLFTVWGGGRVGLSVTAFVLEQKAGRKSLCQVYSWVYGVMIDELVKMILNLHRGREGKC